MKNLQTNQARILLGIIIVLIIGGWVYMNKGKTKTTNITTNTTGNVTQQNYPTSNAPTNFSNTGIDNTDKPKTTTVLSASKCGFKITYPVPGASVSFPFTMKGTIDHTDAQIKTGCTWNEIQGRAGSAQLFYNFHNSGWTSQGVAVPIITSGTQVASTSAFSVSLNFLNQGVGLPSGSMMKISFLENEVGILNPKTFDFYVYFKQ